MNTPVLFWYRYYREETTSYYWSPLRITDFWVERYGCAENVIKYWVEFCGENQWPYYLEW